MNASLGLTRQRQLDQSEEVKRSFKATTSLAAGIMKERVTVQNEFQKISGDKAKFNEELKSLK